LVKMWVLSFPPIINGELTAVNLATRKFFIDVTGTDQKAINTALNIMSTALAERGGKIRSVKIVDTPTVITPDLSPIKKSIGKFPFMKWENDILISKGTRTRYKTLSGRKAYRYSPPGSMPYRQTANYANSIQKEFELSGGGLVSPLSSTFGSKNIQTGYVFTDVPYAPTLEFGGHLQVDKSVPGKYSKHILRNWSKKGKIIAPRPSWIPIWNSMLGTIWLMFKNVTINPGPGRRIKL